VKEKGRRARSPARPHIL